MVKYRADLEPADIDFDDPVNTAVLAGVVLVLLDSRKRDGEDSEALGRRQVANFRNIVADAGYELVPIVD